MTALRSFFAVPLAIETEQQLAEECLMLQATVDNTFDANVSYRWIPPENYHLTLAFLGGIQRRDIAMLHDIARQVVAAAVPGVFTLAHFEWFPSALKPRLLVAVPSPCVALQQLQRELSRCLYRHGFHLEKKAFRPHISLARIKGLTDPVDLGGEPLDIACELDELVLYSSTQGRTGPVYSPLFVEPIGACP